MRRSTWLRILSAVALAPLALAACSGDEADAPGGGDGGGSGSGSGGSAAGSQCALENCTPAIIIDYVPSEREAWACQTSHLKFPEQDTCQGDSFLSTSGNLNYAEALQKALWFFNINKSGPGVTCMDTQWRGDAHVGDAHIVLDPSDPNGVSGMSQAFIEQHRDVLDPDGDGAVDLSGGFHDAGDYIKFGLTNAYAASMVAWSLYEYPDAYRTTGLEGEALETLRFFADYFLRSTFYEVTSDTSRHPLGWNLVAFGHQVGDAGDHTCGWFPPELRTPENCPRKGYFATSESPAADVTAGAAAALAQIALVILNSGPGDEDFAYAEQCLAHAMVLYDFASQYPDQLAQDSGGLYNSEYAWDDLSWAGLWIYEATKSADPNANLQSRYLNDVVGGVDSWEANWAQGWLGHIPGFGGPYWTESHTHVWNSLRSGVFVRLAAALAPLAEGRAPSHAVSLLRDRIREIARIDSQKWLPPPVGSLDQTSDMPPGEGLSMIGYTWGSGRYNAAGQFVAQIYGKYFPDDALAPQIVTWAGTQTDYLLGRNGLGKSYMMGYTETYALQPHHAAGHASLTGLPDDPPENRHILWGALVNGPADMAGNHEDVRGDFGSNEVTIDYNAAFVASLAANYQHRGAGQCPLTDFPPLEPPIDEFYTRAKVNALNDCTSQVEITLINESIHPPRYDEHLTVHYYFDVSELRAAGIDPATVGASLIYDRGGSEFGEPTSLTGPTPCEVNANMYYVELGYEGYQFWGEIVALKAPRTSILEVGVPSTAGCVFDPLNDWSYQQLTSEDAVKTRFITVYSEGDLIFGEEPECTSEPPQRVVPPTDYVY